jgi:transglutaminase-like putative cysteine protease
MRQRVLALAVLAAALAVAVVVPAPIAVVALVLPLLALITGPQLRADRVGQATLTFVAALAGVLLPRILMGGSPDYDVALLSEQRTLLALPMVLVAAARALLQRARFGTPVTLIAALVAVTAAGGALSGWVYPALVTAFLALGFGALALADPHRGPLRRHAGRLAITLAVAVTVAAALTLTAMRLLPALHDLVVERMVERLRRPRVGFSDRLVLDSMRGMLADDRVVMRLRGERVPALLRGAVFTEYGGNRWLMPERLPPHEVVEVASTAPRDRDFIEVENARDPERYFLPLDANRVGASSGFVARDLFGVHYPIGEVYAKRVWFSRTGTLRVVGPGQIDRAVPRAFAPALKRLVTDWGALNGSARQRLRRIEIELRRRYRYSVAIERPFDQDPLLDFLLAQPAGHCEYFASAMALLARAVGVPTRVVTGYRVVEQSPFGYWVVRQRHAHAWVESWVDGEWVSVDPTPPAALADAAAATTPLASAVVDALATTWEKADDWLEQRSAFEFSLAAVLLVGGLLLLRTVRVRRARAARREGDDPPLSGFVVLGRRLARVGLERDPTETLLCFARRVERCEALTEPQRVQVAGLLQDYALLRYASRGEKRVIDRRLRESARGL